METKVEANQSLSGGTAASSSIPATNAPAPAGAPSGQAAAGAGSTPVGARKWITAALMLVMVLSSLEATVTSTAMPTIIGDLHGLEHYSWVASIYLLAATVVMPLYGRLADVLGRKRVIIVAVALFSFGSITAAFSQSMGQMILFRGLQGLGAGGIMPVVLTILGDIFTLEERARIQGVFSAVWGTAALAGPALGAFLVKTLGWPSVFWINLPAGVLGIVILLIKYRDHQKPHSTDLDLSGVALLAIGSTALLSAVSLMAGVDLSMWVPIALLAVAVVLLAIFVRHELHATNPVMAPGLMLQRAIGPSMLISGILGMSVFAVDTYVPLYVQGGRGGDASAAAATITPVMLAWAISSMYAAKMVVKLGFRTTSVIGAALIVAGMVGLFVCVVLNAPLSAITAVLFVTGCGFGPAAIACLLSAQDAVTWQQRGSVTSGVTFFRCLGGAVGVGTLGALFNLLTASELRRILAGQFAVGELLSKDRLDQLQAAHPELLRAAQSTIAHGLLWVFAAMLIGTGLQQFVAFLVRTHHCTKAITNTEALAAIGD